MREMSRWSRPTWRSTWQSPRWTGGPRKFAHRWDDAYFWMSPPLKWCVSSRRRSHCRNAWKKEFGDREKAPAQALFNCVTKEVLCIHSCHVQFRAHACANTDVKTTLMHCSSSSIVSPVIHEGTRLELESNCCTEGWRFLNRCAGDVCVHKEP